MCKYTFRTYRKKKGGKFRNKLSKKTKILSNQKILNPQIIKNNTIEIHIKSNSLFRTTYKIKK